MDTMLNGVTKPKRWKVGAIVTISDRDGEWKLVAREGEAEYRVEPVNGGDSAILPVATFTRIEKVRKPKAVKETTSEDVKETVTGEVSAVEPVATGEKNPDEVYYTPRELCHAMMKLAQRYQVDPSVFAETSAGDGRMIEAAKAVFPNLVTVAFEKRQEEEEKLRTIADEVVIGEFEDSSPVKEGLTGQVDLAVINPPYTLAEYHVSETCKLLTESPAGICVALLRINFLSGAKRNTEWWSVMRQHLLAMHPLVERPSFERPNEKKKGSDQTEYGLYVFTRTAADRHVILGDAIFWKGTKNE